MLLRFRTFGLKHGKDINLLMNTNHYCHPGKPSLDLEKDRSHECKNSTENLEKELPCKTSTLTKVKRTYIWSHRFACWHLLWIITKGKQKHILVKFYKNVFVLFSLSLDVITNMLISLLQFVNKMIFIRLVFWYKTTGHQK